MTDESCAATAHFWHPENRSTSQDRFASAAEGCANDNISACRQTLRFASEEEAPQFLVRSCELSTDHCREAAMHFVEADEPATADELLKIETTRRPVRTLPGISKSEGMTSPPKPARSTTIPSAVASTTAFAVIRYLIRFFSPPMRQYCMTGKPCTINAKKCRDSHRGSKDNPNR